MKKLISSFNFTAETNKKSIAKIIAELRGTDVAYVETIKNYDEDENGVIHHAFDDTTSSIVVLEDGVFVDLCYDEFRTTNPVVMVEVYELITLTEEPTTQHVAIAKVIDLLDHIQMYMTYLPNSKYYVGIYFANKSTICRSFDRLNSARMYANKWLHDEDAELAIVKGEDYTCTKIKGGDWKQS